MKRLDSARRAAEEAAAQAAAEARAAPRQLIRGPNFGRVPQQPGLLTGLQDRQHGGSQRSTQDAPGAAAPAEAARAQPEAAPRGSRGSAESREGTPGGKSPVPAPGAADGNEVVVLESDDDDHGVQPGAFPCSGRRGQRATSESTSDPHNPALNLLSLSLCGGCNCCKAAEW